ncbi:hypothetical protein D3C72_1678630 [compost metagenome]
MGWSGGCGERLSKAFGLRVDNFATRGRITWVCKFIDTEVTASTSSSNQTHTPPERCRSKFSLWPPSRQRKASDLRQLRQFGNDRYSAMKQSNSHTMPTMPINHTPSSMPQPSGMCMV